MVFISYSISNKESREGTEIVIRKGKGKSSRLYTVTVQGEGCLRQQLVYMLATILTSLIRSG